MSAPTILPLICTQVLPRSPCLSEHYPLPTFICGAFFRILHNIKSCRLSVLCCQERVPTSCVSVVVRRTTTLTRRVLEDSRRAPPPLG